MTMTVSVLSVFQPVVCLLFDESPEDMGDLYLDVAEAYMEKGDYTQAKPILSALVASNQYNLVSTILTGKYTMTVGITLNKVKQSFGNLEISV